MPPPQKVPYGDAFVFRYKEKTIQQAMVQKLARVVSGLHAAWLLLENGFLQEQAAVQRMLDEFHEDILFLAFAVMAEKRHLTTSAQGAKSLYYVSGLAEGAETIAFFLLFCAWPPAFFWIAALFAGLCFVSAIARITLGWQVFI